MKIKIKFKKIDLNKIILISLVLGIISFSFLYFNIHRIYPNKIDAKILTWNIHNGVGIDNEYDLERIVTIIQDQQADIVGLQEVTTDTDIKALADELNMNYYYAEAGDTDEGNLLLTKYHIEHAESIELPLIDGTRPRVLIKAELKINNKILNVYITHLSRNDKPIDHINQAHFITSIISKPLSSNNILIGDLNFEPLSLAYVELRTILRDTYEYLNDDNGYTFRSNNRFKRIDYIFCSFELEPIKSEVICSEASDHCAVITTFK